jgi:hypothetical protein
MIYQLPTGKAIEISLEQFLEMTDDDLDYLNAYNVGEPIEDPWFGSVLTTGSKEEDSSFHEDAVTEDLTAITDLEKLIAADLDITIPQD